MKVRFSFLTSLVLALIFSACSHEATQQNSPNSVSGKKVVEPVDTSVRVELFEDPHSYSKENAKVTHLNWEASVDFDAKVISATAEWVLSPKHADTVVFDVKDLEIEKVLVDGESSFWSIEGNDELVG